MFGKIKENIEGYIETRIELIKLETQEQVTKFILEIAKSLILFTIGVMVVFFLSVALAMGINQGFDSRYAGFLFMAGFYLLIFIIVYIYKDSKIINDLITFKPKKHHQAMINGDAIGTEFDYSERKKELQNKKQQFQEEIDSELTGLKANAMHYGKYALIVGGAFVATYVVLGFLFPEEEKEKAHEKIIYIAADGDDKKVVHTQQESTMSPIAKAILTSISTFLISIAKEKLLAYLEQLKSNEGQEDTQPAS